MCAPAGQAEYSVRPMTRRSPTLFIGSSTEGLEWARALQSALRYECDPQVWTDGIFQEGGTALASLRAATDIFDFAAFVFTGDDQVLRRGVQGMAPRDNVVLELGMFLAALGPDRVFVFRPREDMLVTPSDWWGILDCQYSRTSANPTAAMSTAAKELRHRVSQLGLKADKGAEVAVASIDHAIELTNDLNAIKKAANAQGWSLQAWDAAIFRLIAPDSTKLPFTLTGSSLQDRQRIRSEFVPTLVEKGLRVSLRVQAPVDADLRTWRPAVTSKPQRSKATKRTNGATRSSSSSRPKAP